MVNIMKRSYKLIIVMIFLVSAIFYGQYLYSSDLIKDLGEEKINDSFTILKGEVNYWLEDKEKIIDESKMYLSYYKNDEEKIKNFFIKQIKLNSEFKNLYFLSKDNKLISAKGSGSLKDIDSRKSSWYVKAVEENQKVFTETFSNDLGKDVLITISAPVFDELNNFTGVVAGDVGLSKLSLILNENNNMPGSKGFLVDQRGYLIIGSNQVFNNKNIFINYLDVSKDEQVKFNNQEGNLKSDYLESNNWKIFMFTPAEFIAIPVNTLRNNFITTIIIFFIAVLLFVYLQMRVIGKPLVSYDLDNKRKIKAERMNFEALFKNSSDAIVIVDNKNRVIEVNEKFEELFKYKLEEIKNKDIDLLIVTESKFEEAKKYTQLLFKDRIESVETIRYDKFKNPKHVELKGTPIFLDGKIIGGFATYTDISGRKAFESKILYMSYHDQLTGIFNRRYFEEKLKTMDISSNYPISIVMADLNGLKLANDAFGHAFGDKLLIKTSEIINTYVNGDEFVARIGGDEFVIVLPKTSDQEVRNLMKRISEEIERTKIGTIKLSVSFGWDTKTNEDQNIIEVLNRAESFMYKRKLSESPSMVSNTIQVIINTLHEKNKREKFHSERVANLCFAIGQEMSLDQEKLNELKLVGLMHDIGKIGIDENILNKEGKLTQEEYEEIKKHPEIGYRILSSANQMSDIAEYTLAHHERWDGKGYPNEPRGRGA